VFGSIGDKLQIDHLCRNRRCCNPVHLEMISASENIWRGFEWRKSKHKSLK
jgi:hypothetical protein